MTGPQAAAATRLFVACELPREVVQAVTAWQHRALARRADVRASRSLHLTLAFLGDVETCRAGLLRSALASLEWPPVAIGLDGPRFLPLRGRKRVVVLGVSDPSGGLKALHSEVAAALAKTGLFVPPDRPWVPHVTVARYRRPGHPFSLQNVNIPEFGVVRTVLYSSLLEAAGAVHTPLADFPAH